MEELFQTYEYEEDEEGEETKEQPMKMDETLQPYGANVETQEQRQEKEIGKAMLAVVDNLEKNEPKLKSAQATLNKILWGDYCDYFLQYGAKLVAEHINGTGADVPSMQNILYQEKKTHRDAKWTYGTMHQVLEGLLHAVNFSREDWDESQKILDERNDLAHPLGNDSADIDSSSMNLQNLPDDCPDVVRIVMQYRTIRGF